MTAAPPPPSPVTDAAIEAGILSLATASGPARSISPSDVASALQPDAWQSLLGRVRQAAIRLTQAGHIDILRKGKAVPPAEVRGVIRLRVRAAE